MYIRYNMTFSNKLRIVSYIRQNAAEAYTEDRGTARLVFAQKL